MLYDGADLGILWPFQIRAGIIMLVRQQRSVKIGKTVSIQAAHAVWLHIPANLLPRQRLPVMVTSMHDGRSSFARAPRPHIMCGVLCFPSACHQPHRWTLRPAQYMPGPTAG